VIHAQNTAIQQVIDPIADAGSTTAEQIDTIGYDYALILVLAGNVASNASAFEVQESDESGSGFALIPGADFDGGTDIDGATLALPTAASGDDKVYAFEIDLRGRKRYLKPVITFGGTTTAIGCVAILSRAAESPSTTAQRNLASSLGGVCRV
jgi:hypothetical protein